MDRKNVSRRQIVTSMAVASIAAPWIWTSDTHAQTTAKLRDKLIEAQYGTFDRSAMDKLVARAAYAKSINGFDGANIRFADKAMNRRFPDGSQSEVHGKDCSALFFRYTTSGLDNACGAWLNSCARNDGCCDPLMAKLRGTQIVTMIEGPMNLAIYDMLDQFGRHLRSYRNFSDAKSKNRAREIIAPLNANRTFPGSFKSYGGVDAYDSKYASITIVYKRDGLQGNAIYIVRDKQTKDLIFEDAVKYPLYT